MVRGQRAKPAALRLLEGNRGKRQIPVPPKVRLDEAMRNPPSYLKGLAADEWRRVAPELINMGLLAPIDEAIFAAYCRAYALWREAPQPGQMLNAAREMLRYGSAFGLTPVARQHVASHSKKDTELKFGDLIKSG